MKLIVGLGNPGPKYDRTRHNVGFRVIDSLLRRARASGYLRRLEAEVCQVHLADASVLLLKPQTFMNASGRAVRAAANFYRTEPPDIVVIHDELDLVEGTVRLKCGGGDAGHRGLKSLREELGSGDFLRVRLGIGRPPPDFVGSVSDYVLQGLALAELPAIDALVERGADAVEGVLADGLDAAMNRFNARR